MVCFWEKKFRALNAQRRSVMVWLSILLSIFGNTYFASTVYEKNAFPIIKKITLYS